MEIERLPKQRIRAYAEISACIIDRGKHYFLSFFFLKETACIIDYREMEENFLSFESQGENFLLFESQGVYADAETSPCIINKTSTACKISKILGNEKGTFVNYLLLLIGSRDIRKD